MDHLAFCVCTLHSEMLTDCHLTCFRQRFGVKALLQCVDGVLPSFFPEHFIICLRPPLGGPWRCLEVVA